MLLGQLTDNSGCWTGMAAGWTSGPQVVSGIYGRGEGSPLSASRDAGHAPRPPPEAQLHPSLTLSIMAKMRSTLFSGVFSSSGSSTVLPCQEGQGQGWAPPGFGLLAKICPPDLGRFQMRTAQLSRSQCLAVSAILFWNMPPAPALLPPQPPPASQDGDVQSDPRQEPSLGHLSAQALESGCREVVPPGQAGSLNWFPLSPLPTPWDPGLSPPSGKWRPQYPASRSW